MEVSRLGVYGFFSIFGGGGVKTLFILDKACFSFYVLLIVLFRLVQEAIANVDAGRSI